MLGRETTWQNDQSVWVLSGKKLLFDGYHIVFLILDEEIPIISDKMKEPTLDEMPATYHSYVRRIKIEKAPYELKCCASDQEAEEFLKIIESVINDLQEKNAKMYMEVKRQQLINISLAQKIDCIKYRRLNFWDKIKFVLGLKNLL